MAGYISGFFMSGYQGTTIFWVGVGTENENKNRDTKTQYIKLLEESGELARAILKNDKPEFIDAIGDMVVVLTNLAALEGLKIEDCVTSAYSVIASRKGKMINGTFVKETL